MSDELYILVLFLLLSSFIVFVATIPMAPDPYMDLSIVIYVDALFGVHCCDCKVIGFGHAITI